MWISVNDKLPPLKTRVLVAALTNTRCVSVSSITSITPSGKAKWTGFKSVTHWQPLPELPREGAR